MKNTASDCPTCGMQNTLVPIPKHRNGIQGKQCGMCMRVFYKVIKAYDHGPSSAKGVVEEVTWEETQDNRMGKEDYEGI